MNEQLGRRVVVTFKKSSTRDGAEGYDIQVADGATDAEADDVFAIATRLRVQAQALLKGPSLEQQLEESLSGGKA